MNFEKELDLLYAKVGFIVHLSQMIEYNLSNILAFDELLKEIKDKNSMFTFEYNTLARNANKIYHFLKKKSLGYGINKAKELGFFTNKSQEYLNKICKERNFVIHSLFKEDLLKNNYIEKDPTFYFNGLESLINEMGDINNDLSKIFEGQKKQYNLIT